MTKESKATKQLENVRMYNMQSVLQFCTNPNQLLLYDLLVDAVEMCGGSWDLLKIANKLAHLILTIDLLPITLQNNKSGVCGMTFLLQTYFQWTILTCYRVTQLSTVATSTGAIMEQLFRSSSLVLTTKSVMTMNS